MANRGLRILEVEAGSRGQRLGLDRGDSILTVNGNSIPDELALKFYLAEEWVEIEVLKSNGTHVRLPVDLSDGRHMGIKVEEFKTRTCNNSCLFCFIDQLPPNARPSLRVKDDDYRLSFLHGNYITLTNIPLGELDRIIEHALSPLYVSVHATDPFLRAQILGRKKPDDLGQKLNKLIKGGIKIHTQIVLMPHINDGNHLEKTVFDLYGLYPGVDSIAIVPLGLSEHGKPREIYEPVTPAYCRQILAQLSPWQDRFRREIGRTFAYLADEFYIHGDVPLPNTDYYDDFAQIEDGIGMVRRFLDDFETELSRWQRPRPHLRGTLTTATLFRPYLDGCVERLNRKFHSQLKVKEVENLFLGKSITVSGLLAGQDIIAAVKDQELGDFVIIPNDALSRIDGVFLDNVTLPDLSRRIGRPAYPSGQSVGEFFSLLCKKL